MSASTASTTPMATIVKSANTATSDLKGFLLILHGHVNVSTLSQREDYSQKFGCFQSCLNEDNFFSMLWIK